MCQLGETTRMPSLDEQRMNMWLARMLDERHATPLEAYTGYVPTLNHHSSPFKHRELSVCAAGWRLFGLLCELQTHHLDVNIINPVSSFVVWYPLAGPVRWPSVLARVCFLFCFVFVIGEFSENEYCLGLVVCYANYLETAKCLRMKQNVFT